MGVEYLLLFCLFFVVIDLSIYKIFHIKSKTRLLSSVVIGLILTIICDFLLDYHYMKLLIIFVPSLVLFYIYLFNFKIKVYNKYRDHKVSSKSFYSESLYLIFFNLFVSLIFYLHFTYYDDFVFFSIFLIHFLLCLFYSFRFVYLSKTIEDDEFEKDSQDSTTKKKLLSFSHVGFRQKDDFASQKHDLDDLKKNELEVDSDGHHNNMVAMENKIKLARHLVHKKIHSENKTGDSK